MVLMGKWSHHSLQNVMPKMGSVLGEAGEQQELVVYMKLGIGKQHKASAWVFLLEQALEKMASRGPFLPLPFWNFIWSGSRCKILYHSVIYVVSQLDCYGLLLHSEITGNKMTEDGIWDFPLVPHCWESSHFYYLQTAADAALCAAIMFLYWMSFL